MNTLPLDAINIYVACAIAYTGAGGLVWFFVSQEFNKG